MIYSIPSRHFKWRCIATNNPFCPIKKLLLHCFLIVILYIQGRALQSFASSLEQLFDIHAQKVHTFHSSVKLLITEQHCGRDWLYKSRFFTVYEGIWTYLRSVQDTCRRAVAKVALDAVEYLCSVLDANMERKERRTLNLDLSQAQAHNTQAEVTCPVLDSPLQTTEVSKSRKTQSQSIN